MEFAAIYLRFAKKALEELPKNWKAGLQFIDLAIGLGLPETKTQELQEPAARISFEAKLFSEAQTRYGL